LREAGPEIKELLPQGFQGEKEKDLFKLLDNPTIFKFVKEKIIPAIASYEEQMRGLYLLVRFGNDIGKLISQLEADDRPSEKIRQHIQNSLPKLARELGDLRAIEEKVDE
jgi:hypothetical protein